MKPLIAAVSVSIVAIALVAGCSSKPDTSSQNSADDTPAEGSGAGCHSGGGEGSGAGGGCGRGAGAPGEGSGGGCCRAGSAAAPPPVAADEEIVVGLPEGLDKPGYQRIVTLSGGRNVLVWKTEDGYGAASATCTHMGGTLRYNHTEKRLECPIHGSRFRLDGSIINGPAEKNLLVYRAEFRDGKLHLFPLSEKE